MEKEEQVAIIVGAGTSGLATAACLNRLSIPNIVLEREDCFASLWKKKSYDRLHLHLAKHFLVVATGESSDPFTPEVEGLSTFMGEVIHSTQFKSGEKYSEKNVLVVGSGNSGMEIALDLSNHGAKTSIVVRSPMHILTREMMYLGGFLLKYISFDMVDSVGGHVLDLGTCKKIKSREIQVLPAIISMKGNDVLFDDGKSHPFDVIVFATGFRRSTNKWLKQDEDGLLDDDGFAKRTSPNYWKGKNHLYCAGLARRGFYGAAIDAQNIANDIKSLL
ncbi:hypothetical protein F0562_021341 [Nyssa sinensis]|uniref:indole-3-pyruvate monooxygenase n=1 Tax=Nyssa sinensis TaxID=561372 RepID=A0A5J5BKA3_9ASTE|nr:hypothetical protein F0562_021341 [Nyssa sinensis]